MGQVVQSRVYSYRENKTKSFKCNASTQATALNIPADTLWSPQDAMQQQHKRHSQQCEFAIHQQTYLSVCFISVIKSQQMKIMHLSTQVSCVQCPSHNAIANSPKYQTPMKDLKSKTGHKAHNTMYA